MAMTLSHLTRSTALTPFRVRAVQARHASIRYLPTILQPDLWKSLIPRRQAPKETEPGAKRGWNPATFFIIIMTLIGSQAIHIINLKSSFDKFSTETEAKLGLLRDVVRRIKAGENVDVAKELGTGNAEKEREWTDVIKELEEEDRAIQSRRQRWRDNKAKEAAAASGEAAAA